MFIRNTVLLLSIVLTQSSCGQALISQLLHHEQKLILKGSYASDTPLQRSEINDDKLFVDAGLSQTYKHQSDTPNCNPLEGLCLPSYSNLDIYLDIGEFQFVDASGSFHVANRQSQIYCSKTDIEVCNNENTTDFELLLNGDGIIFPIQDLPQAEYTGVDFYVRRLITGWAHNSENATQTTSSFNLRTINGANVLDLTNSTSNVSVEAPIRADRTFNANDTDTTKTLITDTPIGNISTAISQNLHISSQPWLRYRQNQGTEDNPIMSDLIFQDTEETPVIEVRFNLLENLMLYEYQSSTDGPTISYVSFSDWRVNRRSLQAESGGNVLVRARLFYPSQVSQLQITNTNDGISSANKYYYALFRQNELKMDNQTEQEKKTQRDSVLVNYLPYAATPARSGSSNSLKHLMPGDYTLFCLRDIDEDTNGDGNFDINEDIDGDRKLDKGEDINYNGILDEGEDIDGDGVLDLTEDLDGDGVLDSNEDIDKDGNFDRYNEDIDGDGRLDTEEDSNNNGIFDRRDGYPTHVIGESMTVTIGDGNNKMEVSLPCGEEMAP